MKPNEQGFSLIEMMMVVAIVGLLAVVSMRFFGENNNKARRTSVQTTMLDVQAKLERYYVNNRKYTNDLTDLGYSASLYVNAEGNATAQAKAYYRIQLATPDSFSYTITATPINVQASDSCGALTVNEAGDKAPANCW